MEEEKKIEEGESKTIDLLDKLAMEELKEQ